jgi:hypothetical protein
MVLFSCNRLHTPLATRGTAEREGGGAGEGWGGSRAFRWLASLPAKATAQQSVTPLHLDIDSNSKLSCVQPPSPPCGPRLQAEATLS